MYMFLDFGGIETATGRIGAYFSRNMLILPLSTCIAIATGLMSLYYETVLILSLGISNGTATGRKF